VDVRRFGGNPQLDVEEKEGVVRVALTGAKYPGTDLPADMVCEARRGAVNWRMRVTLALGGLVLDAPLERWLAEAEPARGMARVEQVACALGASSRLSIHGEALAEFHPSWMLRLEGTRIAGIEGLGKPMAAEAVTLSLLGTDAASIIRPAPERRTLISLERGGNAWALDDELVQADGGHLHVQHSPFDVAQIEAGETPGQQPRRALVAWSKSEEATLAFQPAMGLGGRDGSPARLPLRSARYAVAFDPRGDQKALVARFGKDPVWVHTEGCSLEVGDGAGDAAFELVTRNGRTESVRCAPALLSVAAPLAGAIVEPTAMPEGAHIDFVQNGNPPVLRPLPRLPVPARPGAVVKPGPVKRPPVKLALQNFTVTVLRPDDMLALRFEFVNMQLNPGGEGGQIAIIDRNRPAYMLVHFPPQNIAEEAVFESSPEFDGGSAGNVSFPRPARSRLAGLSRLAFSVPTSVGTIPYTLEALLDWSKYELSVAPTALPLPAPRALPGLVMGTAGTGTIRRAAVTGRTVTPARASGPISYQSLPIGQRVYPITRPILRTNVRLTVVPKIEPPASTQTAIEAPYRLFLSPNVMAGWVHATAPVTSPVTAVTIDRRTGVRSLPARTELWHTRMAVRSKEGLVYDGRYGYSLENGVLQVVTISANTDEYDYYATLRAIWSPDYTPDKDMKKWPEHVDTPFLMSLDPRDRYEIVRLTSDYTIRYIKKTVNNREQVSRAEETYDPVPVSASRFMLTSLGVWMDVRGVWPYLQDQGMSVEEWRHEATMGRDQYVKVVYKGYLFPFGHQASLVKVTERKFEKTESGIVAYLRQRKFIVVRQPEKTFGDSRQVDNGLSVDRQMPFKRVRITTLVTPNIQQPKGLLAGQSAQAAFWPIVGTQPFNFHCIAWDNDGQASEFIAPLMFVSAENNVSFTSDMMRDVKTAYDASNASPNFYPTRNFAGQKVALAESQKPGDTTVEAQNVTFSAFIPKDPNALPDDQPCFYPVVTAAKIRMPAVEAVAPTGKQPTVKISDSYLKHGWDTATGRNAGQVFAETVGAKPSMALPAEKGGAMALPNLDISGLSRSFGPIGGAADALAGGTFDPMSFFANSAKLLGSIPLGSIIPKSFGDGTNIPKLTYEIARDANGLPTSVKAMLNWAPPILQDFPPDVPLFAASNKTNGKKAALTISAVLESQLDKSMAPKDPTYNVDVKITNFTVQLICIGVSFNALEFISKTGTAFDVNTDVDDVVFLGPLQFVNELRNNLHLDQFTDPPSLDVTSQGVSVGYSVAIPSLTVGLFSLANISLSAGMHVPFIGDPVSVSFDFCARDNPFTLTVLIFGGGGFFGVEVDPNGLKKLEASLEFGATFELNIGVASGGVHLMAGVYFCMAGNDTQLTGYVRCGGGMNVLGLISVSVEFYMSLTYENDGGQSKVWGQASLTIEISILFFSIGVTLSVEREFAGSGGASASLDGAQLAMLPDEEMHIAQANTKRVLRSTSSAPPPPAIGDMMTADDWAAYCGAFG
jgi:hypothetical protein